MHDLVNLIISKISVKTMIEKIHQNINTQSQRIHFTGVLITIVYNIFLVSLMFEYVFIETNAPLLPTTRHNLQLITRAVPVFANVRTNLSHKWPVFTKSGNLISCRYMSVIEL